MPPLLVTLATLSLWLAIPARSQTQSFSFGFTTIGASTDLPECATLGVGVNTSQVGTSPVAVPPFYLLAYPPSGIPSITPIGSDPKSLSWTVGYPAGTKLLIQLADSQGNSGGVDQPLYSVTSGSSSSCVTIPSSSIIVSTQTTSIQTCQPLVLDISGGVPPYTVSIIPQNGLHGYNTTMPANDNQFTWIDRALPNDSPSLLATVHDSTGQYSPATSLISISGGNDITCPGQNDASGQQQSPSQPSNPSGGGGGGGGAVSSPGVSGGQGPTSAPSATSAPAASSPPVETIVEGSSTILVTASSPNSPGSSGGANPPNQQSNSGTSNSKTSNTPVIAGSVAGALALIAIVALAVIISNRRKSNRYRDPDWAGYTDKQPVYPQPPAPTPFVPYADNPSQHGFLPQQHQYNNQGYPASLSSPGLPPGAGAAGVGAYQNIPAVQPYNRSSTVYSQNSGGRPESVPLQGGYPPNTATSSSDRDPWESRTQSQSPTTASFSDRQQGGSSKGPAPRVTNANEVIQHQDAGPVNEENVQQEGPSEVPPAYADIRRD